MRLNYNPFEPRERIIDNTIILLALTILRDQLYKADYPPEVRKPLQARIRQIIWNLSGIDPDNPPKGPPPPPPRTDAYGNPYADNDQAPPPQDEYGNPY